MSGIVEGLTSLPAPALYAAVFAFAALETAAFAGLAVPGETAIVLGGVVAFQGKVPVAGVCVSAVLGAILGDSVGFYLGRRLGTRVLAGRLGRLMGRQRVESTMARIRGGGMRAVILGRFVGVLRAVMPFAAGASGMAYGRFLAASILGASVWGTGLTLAGYLAGNSWRRVEKYVGRASTVLAVVIVTVVLLVLVGRFVAARQDKVRGAWRRFLARPRVAALHRRYERQIAFVGKRFRPGPVAGLQLTSALVALAILGYLLAVLVEQVLGRTGVASLDRDVRTALANQPRHVVAAVRDVHAVLSLPGAAVTAAVTGIASWVLDRRPRALVLLAVVVAGGAALPPLVRALVARPSPLFTTTTLVERTFPATATTVVAATVVGLLVVVVPRVSRWTRIVYATVTATGVVVAAGFAELLAGRAYLSDVVGGAVLGTLWGLAGAMAVTSVWRATRTTV